MLPPSPAAVADYFRRRRYTLTEFSPDDIMHNERLWVVEICGLPDPASEPSEMPSEGGSAGRGSMTGSREVLGALPVPVTHQDAGAIPFSLTEGAPICLVCRKAFSPRRKDAKVCSNRCHKRASRERQRTSLEAAE